MNSTVLTSSVDRLRAALAQLGSRPVRFHHWDRFILGADRELQAEALPARTVAQRERERWSAGRFPSIQLSIADAVFSKQREYRSAVRASIRPFALAHATMPLSEFCSRPWEQVYQSTFGACPRDPNRPQHHHLSPEGRVRTIVAASSVMLALGFSAPAQARVAMSHREGMTRVRQELLAVPGLGDALVSNFAMNVGHLTIKLDVHVRHWLAPLLQIAVDAAPHQFEAALRQACVAIGEDPFEVDQMIWYVHAASGRQAVSHCA